MEQAQKKRQDLSEVPIILTLPTEILLYIIQFLTEARDRAKLLHVSRRLKYICETTSLWRELVWPYYNRHEKDHLLDLLKGLGGHVERLSFPQHVRISRQSAKHIPHLAAAERMQGLVDVLGLCNNVTHLNVSIGLCFTLEQLSGVVANMKRLKVLEIYIPYRGISTQTPVIHKDSTFKMLFNLSAKLKEITIHLEIAVRLEIKDLQQWIIHGFNPPNLSIILESPGQWLMTKLLESWEQWNSQIPAGHTACLRIYHYLRAPLNLFHSLPVFQLQYGVEANLPYMETSRIGLPGLSRDFVLLTDGTCGNETMYKAEVDKTWYDPHNINIIVSCDNIVDKFELVSELDLSKCDLRSEHLISIATTCPHLQRLSLQINQPHCLSIEGMQMIAKHCRKLKGLNLSGIPVNDTQFCLEIWKILVTMKLKYLCIDVLFFVKPPEDDIYKKQQSSLFKQCTTLQALELYCNCHTTRRDYELLHCFPSLRYCRVNSVQHSTCIQDILATCKQLNCFTCHSNVLLQLYLPTLRLTNLQQLCIISQDNDVDEKFMDVISVHGKLIHVFLKIHAMIGRGIATLIKNSPDLITLTIAARELAGFHYETNFKLLIERFGHRKLFQYGMLNLAPLNVDHDYLLRNTDLLPLWPFRW